MTWGAVSHWPLHDLRLGTERLELRLPDHAPLEELALAHLGRRRRSPRPSTTTGPSVGSPTPSGTWRTAADWRPAAAWSTA